jgi:hypothetical protein
VILWWAFQSFETPCRTFLKIDSNRDQIPDDDADDGGDGESMKHGGYGRTEVWVL